MENKNYVITIPDKSELNNKGFTKKIKISPNMTKEKLLECGFTNFNKPTLYFCKMVGDEISFNLLVNDKTLEIQAIDVLDEDFLQPYDYQSMLMKNANFKPAQQVFDKVDEVLNQLQSDGIITGYNRGMYV